MRQILAFFLLAAIAAPLPASDLAREQRLADEIADSIVEGEAVWLTADNIRFLGIYTQSSATNAKGAAIILHGRGFHPDWPEVAGPLRTALPAQGWDTLSLQMPVLGKEAKYYDYVPIFPEAFPRIQAGIDFLRAKGAQRIVLIAHSCGAHMAMAWIRKYGDSKINAFVGIGMGATDLGQPMPVPFPLKEMRVPVLDVYGGAEYPQVLKMAPERLAAMRKAGNPQSRQIMIPGADHYFRERNEELIKAVAGWLNSLKL